MKKITKMGWLGLAIILMILVLCFINFGLIFTLITAFGIAVILGIAKLLDKMKSKKKQKKALTIILLIFLALGILCLTALVAFLIYITVSAPKFETSKLNTKEMTILYDKNEKVITRLGSEKREKVTYDQLPEVLVDAIIATEDSRFFQHNGLDAPRFLKASLQQLTGNSSAGGASTLSMQVIKNSFTSTESSGIKGIIRKFTDIYLAMFKLEKNYTKKQIIEFYVNNHFLGGNIYGVKEAAYTYFGKDISDLNLSEASIIAGMFQSPNYYRPNVNPENATARRNTVLNLMYKHGYITKEEKEIAASVPVESLTVEGNNESDISHKYQGYIDTVVEELEDKYGINAYVTPLKVYTNMDPEKQDAVNDVMNGVTYDWANDVVQGAVSVLDSQTGKILAIGAGRNRQGVNTYNFATQMNRQPGSNAKPLFDYGPGMEYNNWSTYGYSTDTNTYKPFVDEPYSYSNGTKINNWDNKFMGTMTLRRALSLSRNVPAVKAFQMVDNKKIIEFVEKLGIEPEVENGKIHEAHALGAFNGVSPLQLSAAYAAFSNGGYYNEPYAVSKIVYRDTGETVKHEGTKKQAMSDSTAFMMSSVLQDVTLTGSGSLDRIALKTGTTNYDSATRRKYHLADDAIGDSWVTGYTTKTVISMWYGYKNLEVGSPYYSHNLPATYQRDRLFRALATHVFEKNKEEFKQPDSVVKAQIGGRYEYFKKGFEPKNVEETAGEKIPTPTGLKVTANGNRVTISWNAVAPKEVKSEYGAFGYNVYFGNTLLGFTQGTSYSYNTSSPYGTYKVVATFKSYSALASAPATYTLKEEAEEVAHPVCVCQIDGSGNVTGCAVTNNGVMIPNSEVTWSPSPWPTFKPNDPANPAGGGTFEGTGTYKNATFSCTLGH